MKLSSLKATALLPIFLMGVLTLGKIGRVSAATAFVQSVAANNISVTFSNNVTSGDLLAVGVSWNNSAVALNTITADCVTGIFSLANNPTLDPLNGFRNAMGYGIISSSGPCTITPHFSGALPVWGIGIAAHEISGIDTNNPLDGSAMQNQQGAGTGANAYTSGNITTTVGGDYIFGVSFDLNQNGGETPGTGYTGRITSQVPGGAITEDKIQASSGTVAATFTSSLGWPSRTTGVMAFKPATAPTSPPPPSVDTTPPSVPANLSASAVSTNQINLSWTASTDNVGVAGYKVFRNGVQIANAAGLNYSDAGLAAATSYSYAIEAYDTAGNTSAQSASVSATTQSNPSPSSPPPQQTPPTGSYPWSTIINPSRAMDWSKAGIPGGIPSRTAICATLDPGATLAQINSAIAACNSGVVFLNAGTYNLSGEIIMKSNVTLRGAGPDQTILKFSAGGTSCSLAGPEDVCFTGSFNWSGSPQHLTSWTGGYAPGTTQITLASTAGLAVGQVLILDQANDLLDNGQLFVCDNTVGDAAHTLCSTDPAGGTYGSSPGRGVAGVDYNQQEYKLVTAINGNVVTISPGLYMSNWRSSQSPGAWWATSLIENAGIESLTLDHSNSNNTFGVAFFNAYQDWMQNVRSIYAQNANGGGRDHVLFENSAHIVVRDNYFYGTRNSATLSYGVEPWQSGDLLVENNIFQHIVSPLLIGNSEGSVFAYNYSLDQYFALNLNWNMPGPSFTHDAGTSLNLFEGNEGTGMEEDMIHGNHNLDTYFRNQWTGRDPGKTQQTMPVVIAAYSRYMNLIGNVMGEAGYDNNYQAVEPNATSCDTSIYSLGFQGGECNTATMDSLVGTTLMRWGNFDVVNNAPQWNPAEVPSGLSLYPNAVPASQSLPPSFYLSAKPSFWGTMPWPAVGPDVVGGNVISGTGTASTLGGHAYKIPARLCYENAPIDPNYPGATDRGMLLFNGNNCYPPAPSPSPSPTPSPLPTSTPPASPTPAPSSTPVIMLISPQDQGRVSGAVLLSASVSGTSITSLWFVVDGVDYGNPLTTPPYQIYWNSASVPNGSHTLQVKALDAISNQVVSPIVNVTVQNVAAVTPTPSPSPAPSSGGGGGSGGGSHTPSPTPTPSPVSLGSGGGGSYYAPSPTIPAPISPTSTLPVFTKDLRFGSRDPQVQVLQTVLANLNFFPRTQPPTTYFGPLTEHALALFQSSHSLPTGSGGILDQTTRDLLDKVVAANPVLLGSAAQATSTASANRGNPVFTKFLYRGLKDPQVTLLQQFLIKDGDLAPGNATGFYGRLTEAAVIKFQTKNQIDPVGVVGKITRAKLNQ